jgi:hypothetical protein
MVDRFKGHASCQRSIANHRDAFEAFSATIPRDCHAEGSRNRSAGVSSTKVVEVAFATFQVTGHSTLLTKGMEVGVATRDQFVGISLMAYIPDHPIVIKVEGLVQGQGELHNPKTRAQVTSAVGYNFKMPLSNLPCHILKLSRGQAMQLIRMGQLAQLHARPAAD